MHAASNGFFDSKPDEPCLFPVAVPRELCIQQLQKQTPGKTLAVVQTEEDSTNGNLLAFPTWVLAAMPLVNSSSLTDALLALSRGAWTGDVQWS